VRGKKGEKTITIGSQSGHIARKYRGYRWKGEGVKSGIVRGEKIMKRDNRKGENQGTLRSF